METWQDQEECDNVEQMDRFQHHTNKVQREKLKRKCEDQENQYIFEREQAEQLLLQQQKQHEQQVGYLAKF